MSAIESLKAIHQITGQYLNRKNVPSNSKNTSPNSDHEMEAFSILTRIKQLLASFGLQDGVATPPDSSASEPGTPPNNTRGNISPLTLQPATIDSPPKPVDKPSAGVRPPMEVIMGLFAQMCVVSAINLFKHWGVFDAIPTLTEHSAGGISFADLAKKVEVEEVLLSQFHPSPNRA